MTERLTPKLVDAGRRLFGGRHAFKIGVSTLEQLPVPKGVEIALAGRSNVGKSSLINALTGVKGLARASNMPGRTRELNFFSISQGRLTLVDMPGYGFAKASRKDKNAWQALLRAYLRGRRALTRVFLLIDSRHGVLAADEEIMDLLDEAAVTWQPVLTKADKVKPGELTQTIADVAVIAAKRPAAFPFVHATSSETGAGIEALRAEIANLL
ncbi:MAG: YihA family ribosome biogenesis GTP-binding protein [Alphaproteobacteria bacterium]|nr:YihA family ribosome biogenesis GTP-binding protein [Alphaproteobacteria bacterium]